MTFIDLTQEAWEDADVQLRQTSDNDAKREFALCKTALEEAQMRFNRGRAKILGRFFIADLDRVSVGVDQSGLAEQPRTQEPTSQPDDNTP